MASSGALKSLAKARTKEAAEAIALAARANSAKFSRRIPASVKVIPTQWGCYIIAGGDAAPNAYPFETAANHPLWGNRHHWYKQPLRPFLIEAADAASTKAANIMSEIIDDWCDVLDL
jgi:hypothetical protein